MRGKEALGKRVNPLRSVRLLLILGLLAASLTGPQPASSEPTGEVATSIQYLLDYITQSGLSFVRNDSIYNSREAAEHVNKKYEHFKDDIETVDDFIRLCASKSLLSGKPYRVIDDRGRQLHTSEWLRSALTDYRTRNGTAAQE